MGSAFLEVGLYTNMFKSSSMLFLVAVASCLVCVQSQKVFFGGCPSTTIMPNFDPNQYFGDWYENRKFFAIFEFGQRCIKANYADDGNGNIVVTNSALGIITGSPTSVTGIGGQVSPPSGALGVTFASTTTPPTTANYLVLGTDYSSYSVVWSCNDFGFFNTRELWLNNQTCCFSTSQIKLDCQYLFLLQSSSGF